MWHPPTVDEVAEVASSCVIDGDEAMARRVVFRLVERYERASLEDRIAMVASKPRSTGDRRLDALIAGLVEYLCRRHGEATPSWVGDPWYTLDQFWFVSGIQALEASVIRSGPIVLKRRGVFLDPASLTYA